MNHEEKIKIIIGEENFDTLFECAKSGDISLDDMKRLAQKMHRYANGVYEVQKKKDTEPGYIWLYILG